MSLFKLIANLISEEPKKENVDGQNIITHSSNDEIDFKHETTSGENSHPEGPPTRKDDNSEGKTKVNLLETKEELLKIVCNLAFKLFDNLEKNRPRSLVIWLDTDLLTFQTYDTNQYRQRIIESLVNECDVKFDDVIFSIGSPSKELHCTPLGKSRKVYLQIKENLTEKQAKPKKASISIFGNAGSLLKDEYVLSSVEMQEKKLSAYNIGAGEFPKVISGYRQNHIAIDDRPDSPMIEKNKYVSRMHAHIGYSDKFGFFLQVERDGTRLMGKRTRIFRGEQIIEMENLTVKEPLQDGDFIELGKAVVLRYIELKD